MWPISQQDDKAGCGLVSTELGACGLGVLCRAARPLWAGEPPDCPWGAAWQLSAGTRSHDGPTALDGEAGGTPLLPVCLALTSKVQQREWLPGAPQATSTLARGARPGLDTERGRQRGVGVSVTFSL